MLFPSTHRCPRPDLSKQCAYFVGDSYDMNCMRDHRFWAETGVYEAGPVAVLHLIIIHGTTPQKTNMEPKHDDLEGVFCFSNWWFSGSMLNFGGVTGPGYLESSVSLERPAEVSCCQWNLSTYHAHASMGSRTPFEGTEACPVERPFPACSSVPASWAFWSFCKTWPGGLGVTVTKYFFRQRKGPIEL